MGVFMAIVETKSIYFFQYNVYDWCQYKSGNKLNSRLMEAMLFPGNTFAF
jgi:hypothetical protein